ncbi:kinase suppressor of Ras 2-like [Crassostrea angulata]|uniref:kinase suppressor of Ras 2-like n=1 Tax=Magallana angulata TaxID=2784310 RepID=UPI0022B15834|nr:kinase suppressor of Ras 2-like [Crassostrea angulata]XP_052696655.1 kinase suppressor of Ras 2-like [Crassostrea angulata]
MTKKFGSNYCLDDLEECPPLRRRHTFSIFSTSEDKSACQRKLSKKISGDEHWRKFHTTNETPVIFHSRPHRPLIRRSLKRLKIQIPFRKTRLKQESKEVQKSHTSLFRRFYIWMNSKCRVENRQKSHAEDTSTSKFHRNVTRTIAIDPLSREDNNRANSYRYEETIHLEPVGCDVNYVYICNKSSETVVQEQNTNDVCNLSPAKPVSSNTLHVSAIHVRIKDVSPERQPLGATSSCPPRKSSGVGILNINFYGTWPLTKRKLDEKEEECDPTFEKLIIDARSEKHDRLEDFSIAYEDIEFGDCLRVGRQRSIYRGRWHGDVNIHDFHAVSDTSDFWNKVRKLCRIRHENLVLFMGACLEECHLAIILSCQGGISMYDHIHIQREKTSLISKIQFIRQVSYGMGYLHSRDIVHKRLTTRNIFLCPNVRISVVDYGLAEVKYDRPGFACLPRGDLTYIAPEVLCSMSVVPPMLVPSVPFTNETDVYAFGTVVYELLTGHYPYYGKLPEFIIWQTCKDKKRGIPNKTGMKILETLTSKCWTHNQAKRPSFQDISKTLHKNANLHKQHSVSEPDISGRFGTNLLNGFLK